MRTLLVIVSLVLAGCAAPEPVQSDDELPDIEVEATATTGVIRGVVVDPSITPIPDVTVTVIQTGDTATTNVDGAFGFQDLEPGVYFVEAELLGYETVQASVTVEAGVDRPPVVRVLMEEDPSQLPFASTLKWDGFIQCSLSVVALCGAVDGFYEIDDNFITTLEVETGGIDYLHSEMIWQTTQSLSPNMALWQGTVGDGSCWMEEHQSKSPLVIAATHGAYGEFGTKECYENLGNTTDLRLRVFSGSIDGTRPPTANGCYPVINFCAGVGATIEQRFEVFNFLFYGYTPEEGWTFSETGAVPAPQ